MATTPSVRSRKWFEDVKGELLMPIVRIKPATNFQREDLRINNQNIILTDPNNRILEEFEVPEAYGQEVGLEQIYNERVAPLIQQFIQGFNVSVFAYGSTGAGKSQTIEGNKKEKGIVTLWASTLFAYLQDKVVQTYKEDSVIADYKYEVRMQYLEILDENIMDLCADRKFGERLFVEDHPWDGPIVQGASWHEITKDTELNDRLYKGLKSRDNTSNEFGKVSAKATSLFIIDLKQWFSNKDTQEMVLLKSQATFADLPGSEILVDDAETIRVKQGSTLNKVIIAFTQLIKDLANRQEDYVMYDTSTVTKLGKEIYGSNSYNIGIFCCQHGDPKGSSLALQVFKQARKIMTYPVINNHRVIALLRQFRLEAASSNQVGKKKDTPVASGDSVGVQELLDLKSKVNDYAKQIADMDDEITDLKSKLSALRARFQELVKQKVELQDELIKAEEDKIESAKALLDMELQNTKLQELIIQIQSENNTKKLNDENISDDVRLQKAQQIIQELQDRLREAIDEKREIEMEFMALKKNYMDKLKELENIRLQQENYSLELINLGNENKALQEEISKLYQSDGQTNEQTKMMQEKLKTMTDELREKRETLEFAKAEIERLKVELMKYGLLGAKDKLELDKKRLELDKSSTQIQITQSPNNDDAYKNERMLWESQKMELTHKVKSLQRKVNDDNERIKDLEKQLNDLNGENVKMQLQLDEMRAIYRNKLIQIHKLDPRDELFQTYAAKEREYSQSIEILSKKNKQLQIEMRSIKSYSRQIRYLAEDWAPLGQPLPDILHKGYMILDENELHTQAQKDQEQEIQRLRNKNHILEAELMNIKEAKKIEDPNNATKRLISEIQLLKQSQVSDNNNNNDSSLRRERNDLQEENRRLVQLLKDSNKWDLHKIQQENERLLKIVKEYEMIGPQSGQSKNVQQKIQFYEQLTKQLERERTELVVKATVAEEQLVQLQASMTRVAVDYQKQINELKKKLKIL
ncbi:unnamed protein product [Paramecium primaurelia]|uniref:Kinesin motor domain-containing protein n=1 Tax=Paramecium primaurelia TaxID=5886 RepID=A0A8S1LMI2_PARPR|nr:unnamed protein product [Paramecium primaurelia]